MENVQTTIQLLIEMGLVEEKKRSSVRAQMAKSDRHFDWLNLATIDIPTQMTVYTLKDRDNLSPPRTAHIGGVWGRIAKGGGAELALNLAITQQGLGHLLIFDLNQTPTSSGQGDHLYWPGTACINDKPVDLPLYTWNGEELIETTREYPLFSPLTWVHDGTTIRPLIEFHREKMAMIGMDFEFLSKVIISNKEHVTDVVKGICSRILLAENREIDKMLAWVFDRYTGNDARIQDGGIRYVERTGNFKCGRTEYQTLEEIIKATLKIFEVAANPSTLLDLYNQGELDRPLFSKEMMIVLMAVLNTDFKDGKPYLNINPHLHWGAYQMAGAPPKFHGYFPDSASRINALTTFLRVADNTNNEPAMYYLLLPAAPYALFASSGHTGDIDAVNRLVNEIITKTVTFNGKPEKQAKAVGAIVENWLTTYSHILSRYLLDRFTINSHSFEAAVPNNSTLIKPDRFDEMTFRQQCAIIATLRELGSKL